MQVTEKMVQAAVNAQANVPLPRTAEDSARAMLEAALAAAEDSSVETYIAPVDASVDFVRRIAREELVGGLRSLADELRPVVQDEAWNACRDFVPGLVNDEYWNGSRLNKHLEARLHKIEQAIRALAGIDDEWQRSVRAVNSILDGGPQ
jgi:hypothetical protein